MIMEKVSITSRTSTWFETKIRYEKMMEDGLQKRVTELYVVDAMSFTEAESMIIEEMSSYISGEMTIQTISRASYSEIFLSNVEADDKWYKAKLQFNDIDEKTEKEKHSYVNYLVNAGNIEATRKHIDEAMKTSMIPYVVKSISETSIMDVFKHKL